MRTKKKYFMPQWALTKIESVAKFYETTKTQAMLLMLSKGANYYEKVMKKAGFEIPSPKPTDNNVADNTNADTESIAQNLKNWWEDDPKVQEAKKKLEKETQRTIEIAKTKWIEDD